MRAVPMAGRRMRRSRRPYNRCDLWQCKACPRTYLRYTESGGYYEDERIRALDPALVDDRPA